MHNTYTPSSLWIKRNLVCFSSSCASGCVLRHGDFVVGNFSHPAVPPHSISVQPVSTPPIPPDLTPRVPGVPPLDSFCSRRRTDIASPVYPVPGFRPTVWRRALRNRDRRPCARATEGGISATKPAKKHKSYNDAPKRLYTSCLHFRGGCSHS